MFCCSEISGALAMIGGAGGGGFLAAILKNKEDRNKAMEEIRKIPGTERLTFHTATIDRIGIEVKVK